MSITTLTPTTTNTPDPAYYAGLADAYDDHADGTPLNILTVRLSYLIDLHPDTAYVTGYAAKLLELDREQRTLLAAITGHDTYWEKDAPRLRGRAFMDAKTVADAEAAHCRRLGISQAAWDNAA